MPNTHINAFFVDVEEAHERVVAAHAEWEAAKSRLEAKKKEVDYVEPEESKAEVAEDSSTEDEKVDESHSGKHRSFHRK